MRILIINDDGIFAPGIKKLAEVASTLGETWVVAPDRQCSAMSHRITILSDFIVKKEIFPIKDVKAFSVSGTPADCVKIALQLILPEKPDFILSGINNGYNMGIDLLYSGTVGAAMEGLVQGIPSIALSCKEENNYEVVDHYLLQIIKEIMNMDTPANGIWNVNFPGCSLSECMGILTERIPAKRQYYHDSYLKKSEIGDEILVTVRGIPTTLKAEKNTDMEAIQNNYISIGKVINTILQATENKR